MLFKFIYVLYQFHRTTLPIMKIDRDQIQFREYVSTGMEPDPWRVVIVYGKVTGCHFTFCERGTAYCLIRYRP